MRAAAALAAVAAVVLLAVNVLTVEEPARPAVVSPPSGEASVSSAIDPAGLVALATRDEVLASIAASPDEPDVIASAEAALERLVQDEDVPAFIAELDSSSPAARVVILRTISLVGDDELVLGVLAARVSDPEPMVREAALACLAERGGGVAVARVRDVVIDDPGLRRAAARCVGPLPGPEAGAVVRACLDREQDAVTRRLLESVLARRATRGSDAQAQ
jgi:hypothetical protein